MIKKIVLIGAGGFGREIASTIERINRIDKKYELIGFLDDGETYAANSTIQGYPWLGKSDWILRHKDEIVCNCTIGDVKTKARIQDRLMNQGVRFETIADPSAAFPKDAQIGPGCILGWKVAISVNCKLGAGVLLNADVRIGHDVEIGKYTAVMPGVGISGGCEIGEEVSIGGHAFIIPERKVGDKARIAAGSIVFSNIKEGTTVLGNPAKRIKALE